MTGSDISFKESPFSESGQKFPEGPVLVTGATGFVGAAVARALEKQGADLRLLVRKSSDRTNIQNLKATPVIGDLQDEASLKNALQGCRFLFHVAADYRIWVPDPEKLLAVNVTGTQTLMRLAQKAGIEKIIYTGSVAALGLTGSEEPATEETPVYENKIIGTYKRSKYFAEQAVLNAVRLEGLPAVIVNPAAPVGPGDIKPTPTGKIILDAARGKMPAYVDTGLCIVHVEDVAAGHLAAFYKGRIGERYILGGDNLYLREILTILAGLCGKKPPTIRLSPDLLLPVALISEVMARYFKTEPRVTRDHLAMAKKIMFFSSRKAEQELGYTHRGAKESLSDALRWFQTPLMQKK